MFSIGRVLLMLLAAAGLLGTATILSTPGPTADMHIASSSIVTTVDEEFTSVVEVTSR